MDARLRILERQAQISGTPTAWETYARALRKVVESEPDKTPITIWIARIYISGGTRAGETLITLFATEFEARGHILNAILDNLGEIIYDPDMDENWYKTYRQFVEAVEKGKYDEAWVIWWDKPCFLGQNTSMGDGAEWQNFEVESQVLARCGPDIPPTHQTMRIY
jgi:hypothetical protein